MLSEVVYERARKNLARRPTHLLLLEELWPLVKDFDFEAGGRLKVKLFTHELLNLPSKLQRDLGIAKPIPTGKMVPYSHRTIRRTLSALGLKAGNKFSDGSFRVQMKNDERK